MGTSSAAGSNGDVAPIRTITGSNTGLAGALGIAVDSSGKIYAANRVACPPGLTDCADNPGSITVYAANSSGNAAPIATIGGDHTGLSSPEGIALDQSGNIYVASFGEASANGLIAVFAAGSNGDAVPMQLLTGGGVALNGVFGIAVDSSRNIYVSNSESALGSINVFAAGATGGPTPIRIISGQNTGILMAEPSFIALH